MAREASREKGSGVDDISKLFIDHVWVPTVGALTWLAKSRIEKIEAKAEAALSKVEFEKHVAENEKDFEQRRQTDIDLYKMIDQKHNDLRDHVDKKFDAMTTTILTALHSR